MNETIKYSSYDGDLVLINKTLYPDDEDEPHLGNTNQNETIPPLLVNMNKVVPSNINGDTIQSYDQYIDIDVPYANLSYNDKTITNISIGNDIPIPSTPVPSSVPSTTSEESVVHHHSVTHENSTCSCGSNRCQCNKHDTDDHDNDNTNTMLSDSFMEVLTNDYVGSFYLGSISVIGLYLVFRMLQK